MNYDSVFEVFKAKSLESKKPHVQWKCFIQQNLWKKHIGVWITLRNSLQNIMIKTVNEEFASGEKA